MRGETAVVKSELDELYSEESGQDGSCGAVLAGKAREGGDGDEACVNAQLLFQFMDEQSRDMRDFLQSAREG